MDPQSVAKLDTQITPVLHAFLVIGYKSHMLLLMIQSYILIRYFFHEMYIILCSNAQ